MELVLEVVSPERHLMGANASHRFLPAGGVIGRSTDCDWVIPDQTRHMSGRHAIISYEAGQFFITDISTNGVYLNGSDALAKNVAMVLHDEDRLIMGEIQFRARLYMEFSQVAQSPASAQAPARPTPPPAMSQVLPANPMAAVDAFLADRQRHEQQASSQPEWHRQSVSMPDNVRPEQEAFVPPRPVAPPVAAAAPDVPAPPPATVADDPLPENWLDLSIVPALGDIDSVADAPVLPRPGAAPVLVPTPGARAPLAKPFPKPSFSAVPEPPVAVAADPFPLAVPELPAAVSAEERPASVTVSVPAPAPASAVPASAVAAFAAGLGLSPDAIAAAGAEAFMQRAGALLRQCLQGLVDNSHARASLKNEFRLDMTLVNSRDNNPVKLSANADQVLKHLLAGEQASFLSVEDGVQECVEDFQQHQLAMMAGMQNAFMELLQDLSPAELERRFERGKSGLRFSGKAARYWEAYRELHRDLLEEENLFDSLFVEPFARAYDQQIAQLKHPARKKG